MKLKMRIMTTLLGLVFGCGIAASQTPRAEQTMNSKRQYIAEVAHWLSLGEFTDLVTISQMTPGPIAINSATFVGLKIAGFSGALCATFGCILPSCIIVSLIAWIYMKYRKMTLLQGVLNSLRPAVVSLIGAAGLSIIITAFFGEQGVMALQNLKVQAVVIFAV